MVGVDIEEARSEVRRASQRPAQRSTRPDQRSAPPSTQASSPRQQLPDLRDPRFSIERETLKLVIQHPGAVGRSAVDVGGNDFTQPTYRSVWELIAAAGGPAAGAGDAGWATRLRDSAPDPAVSSAVSALGVEPLRTAREPDPTYVAAHVYRLLELTAMRRIADLKSRLQRTNPVEQTADYNRMFGELVALEQHRRSMRELAVGAT
jgi:DNA primase